MRRPLEQTYLGRLHEGNMRFLVEERSGGVSEVTGRLGEVIHHILGRGRPRGFKALPDVLRDWWPHPPMNCMMLTRGEHQGVHKYSKMFRVLLLNLLLLRYPDRMWEGRTYQEWLNEPPFKEWM